VFDVAVRQLESTDAYVFLAAVECLRSFAASFPTDALPRLLRLYSDDDPSRAKPGTSSTASGGTDGGRVLALRARVKLGEVLVLAAQGAGRSGLLAAYAAPLLGALLRAGVAGWRRQEELVSMLVAASSAESAPSGGDERSETATAAAFNIAVELTDFADFRASAIACLGEAAAFLGPALAAHSSDVLGGLGGILRMEREVKRGQGSPDDREAVRVAVDASARVRRAAALSLLRLVEGDHLRPRGLSLVVDALGEHLRSLYELLQASAAAPVHGGDPDAIVRAHARDGLAAVDDAIALYVHPGQSRSLAAPGHERLKYI
jgi:hypothetical protein